MLRQYDPQVERVTWKRSVELFFLFLNFCMFLFLFRGFRIFYASLVRFASGNNLTWSGMANALFVLLWFLYVGFWLFGYGPLFSTDEIGAIPPAAKRIRTIRTYVLSMITVGIVFCLFMSSRLP